MEKYKCIKEKMASINAQNPYESLSSLSALKKRYSEFDFAYDGKEYYAFNENDGMYGIFVDYEDLVEWLNS